MNKMFLILFIGYFLGYLINDIRLKNNINMTHILIDGTKIECLQKV